MFIKIGNKGFISLILWIVVLLGVGSLIGLMTKPEITTWYSSLNRSQLTPPNYVFPIAWTILYTLIAIGGWIIWSAPSSANLRVIKILYIIQLLLNWTWTPLFFGYHLTGFSLLVVSSMDVLVGLLVWLAYSRVKSVSLLMIPYLLWILFATHLNFYIWQNN